MVGGGNRVALGLRHTESDASREEAVCARRGVEDLGRWQGELV